MTRFGYRRVLATGLVLLGVPALALTFLSSMTAILVVCMVRGLGFAVVMVVAGALVATLVPPERRGEGLGITGIAAGVPGVIALPLGLWLTPPAAPASSAEVPDEGAAECGGWRP